MNEELQRLFGSENPNLATRRLTVVARRGEPLLYLPQRSTLASKALELYPAQRPAARIARSLLGLMCSAGLSRLLPTVSVPATAESPIIKFFASQVQHPAAPDFAILAGNPHAPGRRFIFLVFDETDCPCVVAKVGLNQQAIELVEHEASVLEAITASATGVPRVRAVLRRDEFHALALDYVGGRTPPSAPTDQMVGVLVSWINRTERIRIDAVPAWKRLASVGAGYPILSVIQQNLEAVEFHPVLYHGDFAPWNVKVDSDGTWRVLDWERGELVGIPCWDWFHYRVQTGLLVERLTPDAHAKHIEQWMTEEPFLDYADQAGVASGVHDLFLAYLLYSMEIIGPSQSLPAKRDLLNILEAKWRSV